MNVIVGKTKYPDFSLITHDSYLDIFEIKKPSTNLLRYDDSRDNYFWDTEMAKAIIQTENYIEKVSNSAETIRGFIKDEYQIELKIVKPRGIILAGKSNIFTKQKQKDDFRLLAQGNKNLTFLTYDELLNRLLNYINVLDQFSNPSTTTTSTITTETVNTAGRAVKKKSAHING